MDDARGTRCDRTLPTSMEPPFDHGGWLEHAMPVRERVDVASMEPPFDHGGWSPGTRSARRFARPPFNGAAVRSRRMVMAESGQLPSNAALQWSRRSITADGRRGE